MPPTQTEVFVIFILETKSIRLFVFKMLCTIPENTLVYYKIFILNILAPVADCNLSPNKCEIVPKYTYCAAPCIHKKGSDNITHPTKVWKKPRWVIKPENIFSLPSIDLG